MNWREVFKRTGYVLIIALILGLVWWISQLQDSSVAQWFRLPENSRWKSSWHTFILMTIVLGINIINMVDRVFIGHYFRHVRWVIFLCWLGGIPLALLLYRVPFLEYQIFSFQVSLLVFAGAFAVWIWERRRLSRGEISSYLTPEQVVNHLGKPTETIVSESGTMYLYEHRKLKILSTPGHVKAVEKIPPPLPDSILGFSPEQIVNTLGWPERVINLDSKIIYSYKDMKVIFVNGQVADVQ